MNPPIRTINISLPGPMREFVEDEVARGSYSSVSEHFRELLRRAQREQTQERLERLLLAGRALAPATATYCSAVRADDPEGTPMKKSANRRSATHPLSWLGALLFVLGSSGCSVDDGDTGPQGPPGPPGGDATSTDLSQGDDLPGVEVEILGLSGGSGSGGAVQAGDTLSITFRARKSDGSDWDLSQLYRGRALVSGPTFNYQRVIAEQTDVLTASTQNADGSYTYRFPVPIPATYLAPYNDTTAFGSDDGELSGQALLEGTYTVGLYLVWSYTVDDEGFRDAGDAVADFAFGSASALTPRAVVGQENCNACHETLQAHGQQRRNVTLCLLCHTAGAEDRNPATPGASVDFRVMVHRIHNGKHLPSVLGITTNPDGSRNYAATPVPYELAGFNDEVTDFSESSFPAMPSAYVAFTYDAAGTSYTGAFGNGPMPRDTGYSALSGTNKRLEDLVRTGNVSCASCHGDPDGAGPIEAPAQGDLYKAQPSRQACGSCHDDVVWAQQYTSNGSPMPPQFDDSNCLACHTATGTSLSTEDAHRHPYLDPAFNTGVNIDISASGGGTGPGGKHAAGDPIQVTFSVQRDDGSDLPIPSLTRLQMIITGPTSNPQWLIPNVNPFDFTLRKSSPFTGNGTASTPTVSGAGVEQTIAVVFANSTTFDVVGSVSATLAGQSIGAGSGSTANVSYNGVTFTLTQGTTAFANGDRFYFEVAPVAASYDAYVPRDFVFERVGAATAGPDVFSFANQPAYWGRQLVMERTAYVGSASMLTGDTVALGRYVECDSSALALAVSDRVVLDDGTATEEYLQVARVQTTADGTGADLGTADRIWFSAAVRYEHASGGTIRECTLSAKREGLAYTMPTTGATSITTVAGQFTAANPVVVSYRSHARFGFTDAPGEARKDVYAAVATGDSDDIDVSWGDWKGLSLVDGTYTVGLWANQDFTVSPLGILVATEAFNNIATNNTTYRMMAPSANQNFLFGAATTIEPREVIASGDACNRCHVEIAAHGFGRRGWETCEICHSTPGAEDGSKYAFPTWYVGATPGVTMDFRTLLHKIHMGKELANGSSYEVNGIFLGTPYPTTYEEVGYPAMPGGPRNCAGCHGDGNDAWKAPANRDHPSPLAGQTREWRAACASCHDSSDAAAHIDVNTLPTGAEGCGVCHGSGRDWNVEKVHKAY